MGIDRNAIVNSLEEARRDTVALIMSLTAEELELPLHGGDWTVKDVLSHMATSEPGLIATARRIAGGQPRSNPDFDIHRFNQRQVEKHRTTSVEHLLAEMERSRAEMRQALAEMTDTDLDAQGFMSSGTPIDVLGVFRRIGDHERAHCEEIGKAIGR